MHGNRKYVLQKSIIYLLSPLKKERAISLPMISFSLVTQSINLLKFDMLMFTSKQAVISTNRLNKDWRHYPCLAIGKATKNKIKELGGEVFYAPKSFYGEALAKDIKEKFSDKKILYLRPKEVSFNSKSYLKEQGIELEEQIIYETFCIKYLEDKKPKENAIIIFTSPSTIKCFFENFEWHDSYVAVVIGKASQKKLPDYCNYVVSDVPLIDFCLKKALEIAKKRRN